MVFPSSRNRNDEETDAALFQPYMAPWDTGRAGEKKTNAKIWNSNTSWRISSHSLHFRLCNNKPAEHIQTFRSQMNCHRFSVILGHKTWHCSLFFALVDLCIHTVDIFKNKQDGRVLWTGDRAHLVLSELHLMEGSKDKFSYSFGSFAAVDRKLASFEVPKESTALPSSASHWPPWGHSVFSLKDSCSPWNHRIVNAGKAL